MTLALPLEVFALPPQPDQPERPRRKRVARPPRPATARRASERAARRFAEEWYQALRAWRTTPVEVSAPRGGGGSGYSSGVTTLGESGGTAIWEILLLPYHDVDTTASSVAARIVTMTRSKEAQTRRLGELLDRARFQQGPASLERPGGHGWMSPRGDAIEYALAIVTLAAALGAPHARRHLKLLTRLHACERTP